jgi:hypothetical protein
MYKRDIINFLFILSFPVYGIGNYLSAVSSPTLGYLVSCSCHFLIILFYCIDLIYKREFKIRINGTYGLMMLYLLSCVASLFIANSKGLPDPTLPMIIGKTFLVLLPFQSFIILALYNDEYENYLPQLALISLSLLLVFNLVGYFGLGLANEVHSIEGRLNFPFLDGFYSGACLLAIINFLLLYYMRKMWIYPIQFVLLALYFILNMVMLLVINSRLTILLFAAVLIISIVGLIRLKGWYWLSLFTIPILLSSGFFLYEIMNLPALASVLQRVDIQDVITFNGRAFLWQDAIDWLLYDQRGLLFGNGYRGHYFVEILSDVAKLWNEKDLYHMHLHSTSLEILISQGALFFFVFCILFYQVYEYYRQQYLKEKVEGIFFPIVVFLLFIMQVDTFVYMDSMGFIIFSLLISRVALKHQQSRKSEIKIVKYNRMNYIKELELA